MMKYQCKFCGIDLPDDMTKECQCRLVISMSPAEFTANLDREWTGHRKFSLYDMYRWHEVARVALLPDTGKHYSLKVVWTMSRQFSITFDSSKSMFSVQRGDTINLKDFHLNGVRVSFDEYLKAQDLIREVESWSSGTQAQSSGAK